MDTIKTEKFTWINLVKPKEKDIEYLRETYNFHELNLEDCLSTVQRPKIDAQDGYIFIVLHFPKYYKEIGKMTSSELNIFLGSNFLVTSGNGDLKPLTNFFNKLKNDSAKLTELTSKGSAMLLYEIMDDLFDYCFPILDKVSEKLGKTDDILFVGKPAEIVMSLARANQEIITFRKIVSPERGVVLDLEEKIKPFLADGNELYFDDITDAIEKIWNTLENLKEVSESLQRTHDSYITYRLNEIMRLLTVFSAIMLPLTVITGFYGMNVNGLPLAEHFMSAEIITVAMLVIIIVMLIFFSKKKFL